MLKDLCDRCVLGKDAFRIEELWSEMYDHTFWAKGGGAIVFAAISAIEIAMWDIKGKALGVPIYEFLGGKIRDEVRVYANGCGRSRRAYRPARIRRSQVLSPGHAGPKSEGDHSASDKKGIGSGLHALGG
jgi:galactonate dehydratase